MELIVIYLYMPTHNCFYNHGELVVLNLLNTETFASYIRIRHGNGKSSDRLALHETNHLCFHQTKQGDEQSKLS